MAERAPPAGWPDRLRSAADPTGFLPFDRFMELALYAEGVGYYSAHRSPFGRAGDFYTAPSVHPLFAETLAGRLGALLAGGQGGRPRSVAEVGPGDGSLSAALLRALPEDALPRDWWLIDRSPSLSERAAAGIAPSAVRRGVRVRTARSLSEAGPVAGAVVANELLDAQPARRLRWTGAAWVELGLRVGADASVPAEAPARPVPGDPLPSAPEPGTILEVAPAAEGLVRELADHLVEGVALLVDYGMEESELLAGHPSGTLQAIAEHRVIADPYRDPGSVDLSAFVNFTRLRSAARRAGLTEIAFRSQAEALGAWGFAERLRSALDAAPTPEDRVRTQLAAKSLLFGFERFRVLELGPAPAARSPG
jgi:SAM-dependent MidA family methyltransferase